jgi:hypothetical protein
VGLLEKFSGNAGFCPESLIAASRLMVLAVVALQLLSAAIPRRASNTGHIGNGDSVASQ